MKHKTKRALLLAKKYGSIVLCIAVDFLIGVGIYHSVTWVSDKCHKEEPQVVDEYLTEYLRTIEKNDVVVIKTSEIDCCERALGQDKVSVLYYHFAVIVNKLVSVQV